MRALNRHLTRCITCRYDTAVGIVSRTGDRGVVGIGAKTIKQR